MRAIAESDTSSDEEKKLFAKTLVAMIKSFLSDTERFGAGDLRTHAALERGDFLEKIVLQN